MGRAPYRCPKSQVAAQAHARHTNPTGAGGQAEKIVYRLVRVLIVGLKCLQAMNQTVSDCARTLCGSVSAYLLHFPLISSIRARDIVGKRLWSSKVVVRRWGSNDVALSCNLASESGHRSSHFLESARCRWIRRRSKTLLSKACIYLDRSR
jgi:hypothetical protein